VDKRVFERDSLSIIVILQEKLEVSYARGVIPGKATTATVAFDYDSFIRRTYLKLTCTVAGAWNSRISGFYQSKNWSKIFTLGIGVDNNRLTSNTATLITIDNVATIGQQLFDYMQERYIKKVRLYGTPIQPGHSVVVDTYDSKQIQGFVEKVRTDLAGGFISDVEIVGVLL